MNHRSCASLTLSFRYKSHTNKAQLIQCGDDCDAARVGGSMRRCKRRLHQGVVAICVIGAGAILALAQPKTSGDASRPPSILCDADPLTIEPDGAAKITAKAFSPAGRPLTYRFTTTGGGEIKSNGTSAVFKAIRVGPGPVIVTCIATDDRGLTASDSVRLNVTRGD